jgi:hypothetical protein
MLREDANKRGGERSWSYRGGVGHQVGCMVRWLSDRAGGGTTNRSGGSPGSRLAWVSPRALVPSRRSFSQLLGLPMPRPSRLTVVRRDREHHRRLRFRYPSRRSFA